MSNIIKNILTAASITTLVIFIVMQSNDACKNKREMQARNKEACYKAHKTLAWRSLQGKVYCQVGNHKYVKLGEENGSS
jgi:hypothetical protein